MLTYLFVAKVVFYMSVAASLLRNVYAFTVMQLSLSLCVSLCFVIVAGIGLIIVLVFGKFIVISFNPEGRQELLN